MKKYPPARHLVGNQEIRAVTRVLKSNFLSAGPANKAFEKAFAKRIGTKYACAVSSGTAGLHLAMIAAGIKPGDEVITSPFSFIATANAIVYVGARPVFADIDPITYNIDPSKIEKKITSKTRALLIVHIFGQSADMDPILKIAKKYKLKVVEDACESVDATYKGRKVGTFGESAVFGFFPNKQMTTGEGGMIVTNSKQKHKFFSELRNQGSTATIRHLDYKMIGYNYRMDEMSAAIGLVQLNRLDGFLAERKKIAGLYDKYFNDHEDVIQRPITDVNNLHTWFVYVVKIKNPNINRHKIIEQLSKRGIGSKPYFHSIHLYNIYRKMFGYKPGDCPMSEAASKHTLSLPFYIGLRERDIKHIVRGLISLLK